MRKPYGTSSMFGYVLALVLLLPALAAVSLCYILIKMRPGPAFFVQDRLGYKESCLRSINCAHDEQTKRDGALGYERMTRTGRVIHVLNLDELPSC